MPNMTSGRKGEEVIRMKLLHVQNVTLAVVLPVQTI